MTEMFNIYTLYTNILHSFEMEKYLSLTEK